MHCIPVIVSEDYYNLFIILEEANLKRIRSYDPAELLTTHLPPAFLTRKVNSIILMYATDEELRRVAELCKAGDVKGALKPLARGYAWRPDMGDTHIQDGYPTALGD